MWDCGWVGFGVCGESVGVGDDSAAEKEWEYDGVSVILFDYLPRFSV